MTTYATILTTTYGYTHIVSSEPPTLIVELPTFSAPHNNTMAKPQSKTQKRIDNHIRLALTDACEQFLVNMHGFQWLTHQANYSDFPGSLLITCVFDSRESQQQACENGNSHHMQKLIQAKLLKIGIRFKSLPQQIIFDSEQACTEEQEGNWTQRLASRNKRSVVRSHGKQG